jgi:hypothetical protein
METPISAFASVVGLTLFWVGVKKIELGTLRNAILTTADLLLGIVAFVQLGWLGLILFLGLSAVGLVGHSIHLAMQKDGHLVFAATRASAARADVRDLYDRLYASHMVFKYLGPISTAELVALLADRARTLDEIENMAVPVALLSVAHVQPDLVALVERVDRLLRLWQKPASEAMSVADTLTAATQVSAASFEAMLDGMIDTATWSE